MRHLDKMMIVVMVLVAILATSACAQSSHMRLDLNIRGRHGSSHLGYDVGRSGNSSHFGVRYSGPHASFSYNTSSYNNDYDRFLRQQYLQQREIDRLLMERRQMFGSNSYNNLPTINHLYNVDSPPIRCGEVYTVRYDEMPPGVVDWVVDIQTGELLPVYIDGTIGRALGGTQPSMMPPSLPPSRPSDLDLGRAVQPMPSGISNTAFVEVVNEFDCDVYVEFCDPFPGGQTRESFRVTRNSTKQVEMASGRYTVVVYGYAPDKQYMGQSTLIVNAGNNRVSLAN